jgi:hypothetical protein
MAVLIEYRRLFFLVFGVNIGVGHVQIRFFNLIPLCKSIRLKNWLHFLILAKSSPKQYFCILKILSTVYAFCGTHLFLC